MPQGRALLQGNSFEMAIGTLIILNVFSIYLQLEFVGYEAGVLIGVEAEADLPGAELAVFISSYFFTLVFLVELLAKMYFLRCELWYSGGRVQKFNIFDTFVVLLTVVDLWILSPMQVGFNVSVLRVIRFLRVFRALRVVRAFEVFSKLRVLVATVSASFFALFWSMVLLSIVMLLAALGMCQAINTNLVDPGVDSETKLWSYRYYGTPSRALWTVFELTFSGGWPNYARVLVEKVSPLYAVPFAMYIAGIIFAMFRIITALFLKDTLSIAAADADMVIQAGESCWCEDAWSAEAIRFGTQAEHAICGTSRHNLARTWPNLAIHPMLTHIRPEIGRARPTGPELIRFDPLPRNRPKLAGHAPMWPDIAQLWPVFGRSWTTGANRYLWWNVDCAASCRGKPFVCGGPRVQVGRPLSSCMSMQHCGGNHAAALTFVAAQLPGDKGYWLASWQVQVVSRGRRLCGRCHLAVLAGCSCGSGG